MADDKSQLAALAFLRRHLDSQEPFNKEDLRHATGWSRSSVNTYLSKHLRSFVEDVPGDCYRVRESFRPFSSWRAFRPIVSQVHRPVTQYRYEAYANVLTYEFFMPLRNEEHLRMALDSLFFEERVLNRIRSVDPERLRTQFPQKENETDEGYSKRICDWVSGTFGGYSIHHVSGRFKALDLCTTEEAARLEREEGERYLIDETTAVVRFIFPVGKSALKLSDLTNGYFAWDPLDLSVDSTEEADRIRWFFGSLFVETIVELVNAEDEIWMVESGMRNSLHVWKKESQRPSTRARGPRSRRQGGGEAVGDALQRVTRSEIRTWLRANKYEDVADLIGELEAEWREQGNLQRRNWWDILAGDKDGQPRTIAGREFPVLRAAQLRQGRSVTENAISRNSEEPTPAARQTGLPF